MSLDTIHQKFRSLEKEVTNEKLFLWGFIFAITSVAIVSSINPFYLSHYQNPILQLIILALAIFAFMAMSLVLFVGGLAGGITITWFLIKSRDKIYEKNGILAGNSIATNHEFLFKIAYGLFPFLIGFIKSYNDPRFGEVESRISKLENKETTPNELDYNRIIADQRKIIFKLEMKLKEKDLDKELTKRLQIDLQTALESIAKSQIEIKELREKIKKLTGEE